MSNNHATYFLAAITIVHFLQTLTQLDLGGDGIGAERTRHLSEALQHNTVTFILSLHCYPTQVFYFI